MSETQPYLQHLNEIMMEINGIKISMPEMLDYKLSQSEELFSSRCNKAGVKNVYSILSAGIAVLRAKEEKSIFNQSNGLIASGPFKGMKYLPYSLNSLLAPKLLGVYEKELAEYLSNSAHAYEGFVNIGCAEGYYVSGMSFINSSLVVRGVDIDPVAVQSTNLLCSLNQSTNANAVASIEAAIYSITGNCLVLIDVDGREIEVIQQVIELLNDRERVTSFTIIVETDLKSDGSSNRVEIVDCLKSRGLNIVQELHYDLRNRFTKETLDRSDLVRFALAYERSIANQSWVIATL